MYILYIYIYICIFVEKSISQSPKFFFLSQIASKYRQLKTSMELHCRYYGIAFDNTSPY